MVLIYLRPANASQWVASASHLSASSKSACFSIGFRTSEDMRRAAAALRRNAEATSEAVLEPGVVEFVSGFKRGHFISREHRATAAQPFLYVSALHAGLFSDDTKCAVKGGALMLRSARERICEHLSIRRRSRR
jgi:hypothetical protein